MKLPADQSAGVRMVARDRQRIATRRTTCPETDRDLFVLRGHRGPSSFPAPGFSGTQTTRHRGLALPGDIVVCVFGSNHTPGAVGPRYTCTHRDKKIETHTAKIKFVASSLKTRNKRARGQAPECQLPLLLHRHRHWWGCLASSCALRGTACAPRARKRGRSVDSDRTGRFERRGRT